MPKFKHKPTVIEAQEVSRLLLAAESSWKDLPQWARDAYERGDLFFRTAAHNEGAGIVVHTLNGKTVAKPGDFVICGVKGEVYPCDRDVFFETYEQIHE